MFSQGDIMLRRVPLDWCDNLRGLRYQKLWGNLVWLRDYDTSNTIRLH